MIRRPPRLRPTAAHDQRIRAGAGANSVRHAAEPRDFLFQLQRLRAPG